MQDIRISREIGTDCVEIHTGKFSNLVKSKKKFLTEFKKIAKCSKLANDFDIEVHAGHGLDFQSVKFLTKIKEIKEFNIGHYLIGDSVFYSLPDVIKKFKKIINKR